jgi:hypothetical protein
VYKSRLLIYDAGEGRTSWISFWKALALLQCGTTIVFFVPPLWKNENQPDVNLRQAQAVLGEWCFLLECFVLYRGLSSLLSYFLYYSVLVCSCYFPCCFFWIILLHVHHLRFRRRIAASCGDGSSRGPFLHVRARRYTDTSAFTRNSLVTSFYIFVLFLYILMSIPNLTSSSRRPRHHPHPNTRLLHRPLHPTNLPPNPRTGPPQPCRPHALRTNPHLQARRNRKHQARIHHTTHLPVPQKDDCVPTRATCLATKEFTTGESGAGKE